MRLLLDTHIAAWAVLNSTRLSRSSVDLIEGASSVAVSMASLWEIALKNNLGRPTRDPIGLTLANAREEFAEAGFATVPIEPHHLAIVERLDQHHGDPFDRLLVATALADSCRLVTSDKRLAAYGDHVILV